MTDGLEYPNVRAKLVRTRSAPGTETVALPLVILLRDRRFRVVDQAGRAFSEIVEDVTSARGFGATPRTMEDFMDASSRSGRGTVAPTVLSGNFATGVGEVRESGREPWAIDAGSIAPVAEQILHPQISSAFEHGAKTVSMLGRQCIEYRTTLEGDEDGYHFRSAVRLLVSAPFVLLREVSDEANPRLAVTVQMVELERDVVTEDDI